MLARTQRLSRFFYALTSGAWLLTTSVTALADDQPKTETVVVTGTRIPRPDYELPNPVVSIGSQEISHNGTTNLTNYLERLPALVGSLGDSFTSGYGTLASDAGASLGGLDLLSLRNLGYIRTLVLIDGRRHVAESPGGAAIDINTIPITLIDRVEISTGGASAIYGADGVTGVVNFVMKHDLEGVHAKVQVGTSQDGGGTTVLAAASVGWNFDDDKGNLTLTHEYSQDSRLFFTHRSFTKVGGFTQFVPNPADPNDDPNIPDRIPVNNHTFIWSAPTGAISTDFNLPNFLGNGQPFIHGVAYDSFDEIGGSGQPAANVLQGDLLPQNRRQIAQASGKYEFSPFFKISGEFKWAHVDTRSLNTPPFDDFVLISADNAFLPANVRNAILANGTGFGLLGEDYLALRRGEQIKRDTYRGVIDVTGDIAPNSSFVNNLKYDLSYVFGETNVDDIDVGNRVEDRFFAALDSVVDPSTGKPTCRSNLDPGAIPPDTTDFLGFGFPGFSDTSPFDYTQYPLTFTPGPNSGCVPFNPFDPNANQAAALAFITKNTHTKSQINQHVITGTISGEFAQAENLLAGPLSFVVGGEYRFERSISIGDPNALGGRTFDPGPQNIEGSFDVKEAFAEISQPLIKDQPLIKELTLDAAIRQSSYSTSGDTTTWKVGGLWAPIDGLRFRGTEAVAVRAPNVGELFAPSQTLFDFVDDPCDKDFVNSGTSFRKANCVALFNALGVNPPYDPTTADLNTGASIVTIVSGNPALLPETARTFTAGFVIQPEDLIPGLSVSADWYRVNIKNAITAPAAQDIANECVDLSTINNPFCSFIVRNPANKGFITQVTSQQINVAAFLTSGVDFTATYQMDPTDWLGSDIGTFNFHLVGNHLNSLELTPLPGEAPQEHAGESGVPTAPPAPRWQATLDVVWNLEPWTVDYNIEWYSRTFRFDRQTEIDQPDRAAPQYMKYPDRFVQNIQVDYAFRDFMHLYVGVNNLFYQKPAIGSNNYPVSPLGRFIYTGVNIDLDHPWD